MAKKSKYIRGTLHTLYHNVEKTDGTSVKIPKAKIPVVLDPKTGRLGYDNSPVIKRRYFEDRDGEVYEACPCCGDYILKTVVGDRADLSYGEYQVCPDKECDFNANQGDY